MSNVLGELSFFRQANCEGAPTEWFFPTYPRDQLQRMNIQSAKELCSVCLVREECEEYGIKHERDGIWGGKTEKERNRERTRRQIKVSTPSTTMIAGLNREMNRQRPKFGR